MKAFAAVPKRRRRARVKVGDVRVIGGRKWTVIEVGKGYYTATTPGLGFMNTIKMPSHEVEV